jgi:hypothetical protein
MFEIFERIAASLIILALLTLAIILFFPAPPYDAVVPPSGQSPLGFPSLDFDLDRYIPHLMYGLGALFLFNFGVSAFANRQLLGIPLWSDLKLLNENKAFQLSYVALLIIPLFIYVMKF